MFKNRQFQQESSVPPDLMLGSGWKDKAKGIRGREGAEWGVDNKLNKIDLFLLSGSFQLQTPQPPHINKGYAIGSMPPNYMWV